MAKYLRRSCPKCDGCLGIVLPERKGQDALAGDQRYSALRRIHCKVMDAEIDISDMIQ
jgi:hypothetical protein